MIYLAYDDDGRIIQRLTMPDQEALMANVRPGLRVLAVPTLVDDATNYVDESGQVQPIPAAPSPDHVWMWATKTWQDPRSLQDRRDAAWERLKTERSAREYGGFSWDGSRFDSDPESRARIMGAVELAKDALAAGVPFSRTWRLADNSLRELDALQMIAVGRALGLHVGAVFDAANQLWAQLQASDNPETITWPSP